MKVQLLDWWGKEYSLRVGRYPQWVEELGIRWTSRSSECLLLISSSLEEVKNTLVTLQEEAVLQEEEGIEWVAPSSLHSLLPGEWKYPRVHLWDDPREEEEFAPAPEDEEISDELDEDEWGGYVPSPTPSTRGETPKWKVREEARKERSLQRKKERRAKYR